jgi:hypothetical protein
MNYGTSSSSAPRENSTCSKKLTPATRSYEQQLRRRKRINCWRSHVCHLHLCTPLRCHTHAISTSARHCQLPHAHHLHLCTPLPVATCTPSSPLHATTSGYMPAAPYPLTTRYQLPKAAVRACLEQTALLKLVHSRPPPPDVCMYGWSVHFV